MSWLHSTDRALAGRVEKLPSRLRPLFVMATTVGYPAALGAILAVVMISSIHLSDRSWLYREIAALLLLPLSAILKLVFRRVRPDTLYVRGMRFRSFSFPSGHAQDSAMVYGLLACLAFQTVGSTVGLIVASALTLLVGLIGVSRVYLGAHFPTDVIGGWVIGAVVLAVVLHLA